MSVRLPGTIPPPRTVSNSRMPVVMRATLVLSTSRRRTGRRRGAQPRSLRAATDFGDRRRFAENEFHASHDGQRPSHRADSKPQAEQKKTVRAFATAQLVPSGCAAGLLEWAGRDRSDTQIAIDGPAASGKTTVGRMRRAASELSLSRYGRDVPRADLPCARNRKPISTTSARSCVCAKTIRSASNSISMRRAATASYAGARELHQELVSSSGDRGRFDGCRASAACASAW